MKRGADKQALACNYAVATKVARLGALCYVLNTNGGSGGERIEIIVRSRGGRGIRRWESAWRLHNFRFKNMPAAHPLYKHVIDFSDWSSADLERFNRACNEKRGGKLAQIAGLTKGSVNS